MTWNEAIEKLAAMRIPFSLTFDRDYGIDKKTGWTLCIRGFVRCQFAETPAEAVFEGLLAEIFCNQPK